MRNKSAAPASSRGVWYSRGTAAAAGRVSTAGRSRPRRRRLRSEPCMCMCMFMRCSPSATDANVIAESATDDSDAFGRSSISSAPTPPAKAFASNLASASTTVTASSSITTRAFSSSSFSGILRVTPFVKIKARSKRRELACTLEGLDACAGGHGCGGGLD